ncbi:MAG: hypothetical protein MJ252_02910 [archaeon]|nr:hypothetical protein [archaeon]
MGKCCSREQKDIAEDFANELLSNSDFTLNQMTHGELLEQLSKIEGKESKNFITKNKLESFLNDLYSTQTKPEYVSYYSNLFNEILLFFPETKISKYKITLFLFPFLFHKEEDGYALYQLLTSTYVNLTLENFEEFLNKYISICTFKINHSIWKDCKDNELSEALDDKNSNYFNEENIKIATWRILTYLRNMGINEADKIGLEHLKQIYTTYNLDTHKAVRNFVYKGF